MTITFTVSDFSVIGPDGKKRLWPVVRFSVTVVVDGTPWWTSEGWRIFNDRSVVPPSQGRFGKKISFHQVHPDFINLLRDKVLKVPGVENELGPPPGVVVEKKNVNRPIPGSVVIGGDDGTE